MATANSPTPFRDRDWLRRAYPLAPPHSSVRLIIRLPDLHALSYIGSPADLVSAGVATREMVRPGKKGTRRHDPAGQWFSRQVHANGRLTIVRYPVSRAEAMAMPGVAEQVRSWPGACVCQGLIRISQDDLKNFAAETQ